jgi:hypothetical protein
MLPWQAADYSFSDASRLVWNCRQRLAGSERRRRRIARTGRHFQERFTHLRFR